MLFYFLFVFSDIRIAAVVISTINTTDTITVISAKLPLPLGLLFVSEDDDVENVTSYVISDVSPSFPLLSESSLGDVCSGEVVVFSVIGGR